MVVGFSTLIGCGAAGPQAGVRSASDAADVVELRAEIEAQADEIRLLRGQLALARAEVQEVRSEAPRLSERGDPNGPAAKGKGPRVPPWLAEPVTVSTADGNEEVLQVFEGARLSTTSDVPDLPDVPELPEFIDEAVLASPPPVDTSVEAYRQGLALIREQRFDEGLRALDSFLEDNPHHSYADNALFWRGEIHYLQGRYPEARRAFETIEKQHPHGNKLPDALYRLGQIHARQGNREEANAYFAKLRREFPDTAAARLALREDR